MLDLTEAKIARRLAEAQKEQPEQPQSEISFLSELYSEPPRPAAVLIPLLRSGEEWHILYTRRNAALPEHSGQVAFPGGRADPGDRSPEDTALREAYEEIGLRPMDVRLLGRLNDFLTITNYRVTPVVGVIPWPYPLELAHEEVSRVFSIPLAWLADKANFEMRERVLPAPYSPVNVYYFSTYDGEILWGVSARFTLRLLQVLFPGGDYP